jgi:hypothetical protein
MDGHGSHITADAIAYCMEHAVYLLVLPPHTSHMLQPLDVSVFSALKRALAAETMQLHDSIPAEYSESNGPRCISAHERR